MTSNFAYRETRLCVTLLYPILIELIELVNFNSDFDVDLNFDFNFNFVFDLKLSFKLSLFHCILTLIILKSRH